MKNRHFIVVSILFYFLSLILPVYWEYSSFLDHYREETSYELMGGFYLLMGWITVLESFPDFICWLGNIPLFLSWIFYQKKISRTFTLFSFAFMLFYGLHFLMGLDVIELVQRGDVLFGYWFWLASAVAMLFYHFYLIKNNISESQI